MFVHINEAQGGIFLLSLIINSYIERNRVIIFNLFVYKTNGVHAIIKRKKK